MIDIKIKDKEGSIFATDLNSKKCIYEIHFGTSYTQFEVQEEYIDEENKKRYKRKSVIVPIKSKNDIATAIDFFAVSDDEIGELV